MPAFFSGSPNFFLHLFPGGSISFERASCVLQAFGPGGLSLGPLSVSLTVIEKLLNGIFVVFFSVLIYLALTIVIVFFHVIWRYSSFVEYYNDLF